MMQKAVLTFSAFAVASVAAVQAGRVLRRWRKKHLRFDFPIEEGLFIGSGSGNPRRVRRPA